MGTWFNQSLTKAESIDDWLSPQRKTALELLRNTAWPTNKTEAWKYTSLRLLDSLELDDSSAESHPSVQGNNGVTPIDNFDCFDIVFVDGVLQTDLENAALAEGLKVRSLTEENGELVRGLFGKTKSKRHVFGLINDVLVTEGVVIEVEDNKTIDLPIRVSHVFTSEAESHTRTLVKVGKNAKINIVENFSGNIKSVNTNFTEIVLAKNASLDHGRFILQGGEAISIGGCHFQLEHSAQLNSNVIGFGSDLSRLDIDIVYVGEHAHAKLQSIYLLDRRELFDLHTNVEHQVPNCVTKETVRGIAGGESRAVFNGRIHIHQYAQKTLAELSNRNLLLSDRAEINTKPELEIYADDVRCAHGATVAQVDKKALYYLRSRGVDLKQAQVMLNFAFINQLINEIDSEALGDWLRLQLEQRFVTMCD